MDLFVIEHVEHVLCVFIGIHLFRKCPELPVFDDINAGDPVLANTFTNTFGSTSNPDDVPVSEFCYNGACDLGKKAVTGTGTDSVYLYFRTGEDAAEEEEASAEITESTEAAVFGGSSLIWIIVLIVVVLGAGTGVIVYTRKKRKRNS
jgi:hypothetical protein